MAKGVVVGAGQAGKAVSAAVARDLFAGSIGGVLSIAYSLSYAALIFSGPLSPWLAYGVSASLVTGAVSAAIVAARSSLPFTIGGPGGSTSAGAAGLAAGLAQGPDPPGPAGGAPHPGLVV